MKTVATKITDEDYEQLKKIAEVDRCLLSEVLRAAIKSYIEKRKSGSFYELKWYGKVE